MAFGGLAFVHVSNFQIVDYYPRIIVVAIIAVPGISAPAQPQAVDG